MSHPHPLKLGSGSYIYQDGDIVLKKWGFSSDLKDENGTMISSGSTLSGTHIVYTYSSGSSVGLDGATLEIFYDDQYEMSFFPIAT